MASPTSPQEDQEFLTRAVETTVRIGIVALLIGWCFQIVRPFIIPVVWGVIIATAIYPAYRWTVGKLGGRSALTASLFTLVGLALLFVPAALSAGSLVDSGQWLVGALKDGGLEIPPAPPEIAEWPVIGEPLHRMWTLANVNLEAALRQIGPELTAIAGTLVSGAAGAGLGLLQFIVSIVIAGVLLAQSAAASGVALEIGKRLAGERGAEYTELAGKTVRSVATGILGVAIIQSMLIGVGFVAMGIPHAALWTVLCLFLAVIQLPTFLVVLPIVIWVFMTGDNTVAAVVFGIWGMLAGLSDNVLKPILLGRGLDIPIAVIFMGAIGGFMSSGFIGLFVGAVVLALGYELFRAWLGDSGGESDGDGEREGEPA